MLCSKYVGYFEHCVSGCLIMKLKAGRGRLYLNVSHALYPVSLLFDILRSSPYALSSKLLDLLLRSLQFTFTYFIPASTCAPGLKSTTTTDQKS